MKLYRIPHKIIHDDYFMHDGIQLMSSDGTTYFISLEEALHTIAKYGWQKRKFSGRNPDSLELIAEFSSKEELKEMFPEYFV
jgi:hypothetical protein